jgi:ABC-type nitrate/sulfonate/bicarbonate transport system substrate-binding protein
MKSSLLCCWLVALLLALLLPGCGNNPSNENQVQSKLAADAPLIVGISPYQDIAQIVNEKNLGLEKKYGTKLEFVTMAWDDILPAVASNGRTVDVGFGSLIEWLSKVQNLNGKSDDPVLFIHPAYVFRGGGFISFNKAMPELTRENIDDLPTLKKFLSFRFGIQKNNQSDMILYSLARRAGIKPSELHTVDNTINDCLLACEQGSLDASFAGLTQRTEALKRGGRVVLTMDTVGLADVTGFVCKQSTLEKRRKEIESLIRIWYDCSNYVTSDLDHHSAATLAYLKANASTHYTLAEFKVALTQEYFPRSVAESQKEIISPSGKYSIGRISQEVGKYLVEIGAAKTPPAPPKIITFGTAPK